MDGKVNAKINSAKARSRADELQARLQKPMEDLQKERCRVRFILIALLFLI